MVEEFELKARPYRFRIKVSGNLRLTGGETQMLTVEHGSEHSAVRLSEDTIRIACDTDCVVHMPMDNTIEALRVEGDCMLQQMRQAVSATSIGGDLSAESIGTLSVKSVGGDVALRQVAGPSSAKNIGGDAAIDDVKGPVSFKHVGGDLSTANCTEPIAANVGGNIVLNDLRQQAVSVNAGGDIACNFAPGGGAQVRAVCSGDLTITYDEQAVRRSQGVYTFSVGNGEGTISAVAGGDVRITGAALHGDSVRGVGSGAHPAFDISDFGVEMGRLGEELGTLGARIGQEVTGKIERELRTRLADKLREVRHKTKRSGGWPFDFDIPAGGPEGAPPGSGQAFGEESSEPVSEEERMMILRMLEEGKITAAEAETLLAALEGEHPEA